MAKGLCSLIFVARWQTVEATVRDRVEALLEFYRPLGIAGVELARLPRLSLLAGEVRFGSPAGRSPATGRPAWSETDDAFLLWGGPVPAWLNRDRLLAADDVDLRGLDRTIAGFAADPARARLVAGCAGAATLFTARSPAAEAWSSHAVAAGYIAHGSVSIDPATLPEFFAAEFVGADRTHLRDVAAVPAATDIAIDERGASARSYWPARERFARIPESEAPAAAEAALLESLASRLDAPLGGIELGLTAGADSRVAAVALRELGIEFAPVTFAPGLDAPDAQGAGRVAKALGISHRLYRYQFTDDADAVSLIDADARWTEGLAPLTGLGVPEAGQPALFVTGAGGETARA